MFGSAREPQKFASLLGEFNDIGKGGFTRQTANFNFDGLVIAIFRRGENKLTILLTDTNTVFNRRRRKSGTNRRYQITNIINRLIVICIIRCPVIIDSDIHFLTIQAQNKGQAGLRKRMFVKVNNITNQCDTGVRIARGCTLMFVKTENTNLGAQLVNDMLHLGGKIDRFANRQTIGKGQAGIKHVALVNAVNNTDEIIHDGKEILGIKIGQKLQFRIHRNIHFLVQANDLTCHGNMRVGTNINTGNMRSRTFQRQRQTGKNSTGSTIIGGTDSDIVGQVGNR